MKKVEIAVPEHMRELVKEKDWELTGVTFEIDDSIMGVEKDMLSRRANALGIRQYRLLKSSGTSIHEDEEAMVIASKHYAACRRAVKGIHKDGKEMEPQERASFLDSVGLMARDAISDAVVSANELGLKNV